MFTNFLLSLKSHILDSNGSWYSWFSSSFIYFIHLGYKNRLDCRKSQFGIPRNGLCLIRPINIIDLPNYPVLPQYYLTLNSESKSHIYVSNLSSQGTSMFFEDVAGTDVLQPIYWVKLSLSKYLVFFHLKSKSCAIKHQSVYFGEFQ